MIYKILSLLIAIIIAVTGCTATPATTSPTATTQPKAAAATPKPGAEPTKPATQQASPTAKPQASGPSGTLTSAIASFGEDALDPILSGSANHSSLVAEMFEQLAMDDGKGKLVPVLAESWSMSPDGKAWTLKIRKGIKFHNGDELTSADVKFSLERIVSKDSRALASNTLRPVVDRIETPDPYTAVVGTKTVTVSFIDLLSGGAVIMPKKYVEEKGEDYFAKNPVGTGPWKFVKHEPGTSVEYEAVKDHWRITPAFQKLVVKLVPEEGTRVAMLKRGEVDVTEISLDRVDELKAAGLAIQSAPYESQPRMHINGTWLGKDMPMQDLKVRNALSFAINREEMAKTFFKGFATPAIRANMNQNTFGWDPSWKADPYDPEKAKQLLAEAGYPGKFKDPIVTLWSTQAAGAAWMPQFVQMISGYWEAIGVKTRITPIDQGALRAMYIARPPDPKIVGTAYPFNGGASREVLTRIYQTYGSTGSSALINDPEWDALYNKTIGEVDEAKRIELLRQLADRGHYHYAALTSVSVKALYATSNRVGEWRALSNSLGQAYEGMQRK